MGAGLSFVEALAHANALLAGIGILISIVGVASILYQAFGRRS